MTKWLGGGPHGRDAVPLHGRGFFLLPVFVGRHYRGVGISLQQFEQMKARVKSPRGKAASTLESAPRNLGSATGVILGIDPSLRGTGFGVIRAGKGQPQMLVCGTITCPAGWERSRCLAKISLTLRAVVKEHTPTV